MCSTVQYNDDTLIIITGYSRIQTRALSSLGSGLDNPVILVQFMVVSVMLQFAYITHGLTHKFLFQNILWLSMFLPLYLWKRPARRELNFFKT